MELKGIIDKIHSKKEKEIESFVALKIGFNKVRAGIWTVEGGKVRIAALGNNEDWSGDGGLIDSIDKSLSSAAEKISSEKPIAEPKKVVLGLPPEWVADNKIFPEKIKLLKELAKKLGFSLSGFVMNEEAIVYQMKLAEGVPPTAILAYLEKEKIIVSLVKIGKVILSEVVRRSDNVGSDLKEGLSRSKQEEALPSRIVVYGESEVTEKIKQDILDYPWQEEQMNFLHLPKVEIMEPDDEIKAIALAGGQELAGVTDPQISEETEEPEEQNVVPVLEQNGEVGPEAIGFVVGQDIVKEPISEEPTLAPEGQPEKREVATIAKESVGPLPASTTFFGRIKSIPRTVTSRIAGVRFRFSPKMPFKAGLLIVVLLLILGGSFAYVWAFPKAVVTLYLKPQLLEKDFEIKLSPHVTEPNKESLTLPAEAVDITLSGEKEMETTGTKKIGDQAKGEVTIYNLTNSKKTLEAGTEIIGPNNLKFTLDEETTIASQSAGADYTRVPGKTTALATAKAIGPEGNLAAGTEFTIGQLSKSDYVAKNDSAFSGGTSRDVQAVSEKDRQKLLEDLTKELKEKAGSELVAKTSSDKKLVEGSLSDKVVSKKYDGETGEIKDVIKLVLEMEFSSLSYSDIVFKDLIDSQVRASVPNGFNYNPDQSETSFSLDEITKDGVALFKAHFKAKLIPIINTDEIRDNLRGKKPVIGKNYLNNLPNVESFEAVITPHLPGAIASFPRVAKNIKVEASVK